MGSVKCARQYAGGTGTASPRAVETLHSLAESRRPREAHARRYADAIQLALHRWLCTEVKNGFVCPEKKFGRGGLVKSRLPRDTSGLDGSQPCDGLAKNGRSREAHARRFAALPLHQDASRTLRQALATLKTLRLANTMRDLRRMLHKRLCTRVKNGFVWQKKKGAADPRYVRQGGRDRARASSYHGDSIAQTFYPVKS